MFKINEKDMLGKVAPYRLQRPGICFDIDVLEIIAGETTKKFQAIPTRDNHDAPKEYCGFGESEIDALEKCLTQIKDVSNETLESVFGENSQSVTVTIRR